MKALHETRAAVCRTPSQVAGVRFYPGGSYEMVYRQNFLCSKKRYILINFKSTVVDVNQILGKYPLTPNQFLWK